MLGGIHTDTVLIFTVKYGIAVLMPQLKKKPTPKGDYNMERAMELRAMGEPGFTEEDVAAAGGHFPSVDPITGMFLKSAKHPTVIKELLHGHLGADVYKDYDIVKNPEGYFGEDQLQYVPKRK